MVVKFSWTTIEMPLEWWQLAFAAFTSIMMAGITAWAQIQNRKWEGRTKRWEEMTQQAVDTSKETKKLVAENTKMTEEITQSTNGVARRLNALTAKSSYAAGLAKGIADEKARSTRDDLDDIEEFHVTDHNKNDK